MHPEQVRLKFVDDNTEMLDFVNVDKLSGHLVKSEIAAIDGLATLDGRGVFLFVSVIFNGEM